MRLGHSAVTSDRERKLAARSGSGDEDAATGRSASRRRQAAVVRL